MRKLYYLLLSFSLFTFQLTIEIKAQTTATFTQVGPVKFPANPSVQTTGMGRVSQLVYHPTDSNNLFAVTASGGIFKSSNEGTTWKPLTDNFIQTSCASILINPLNPNVMYLGTGDANYNAAGTGVYKSINGGLTWTVFNTGMGNKLVTKMVYTPGDTSTIIAACSDGIYKTINSGSTWVKKSTVTTSYRDLHYRPQSNAVVYAASQTNFYRSYDNGETWTQSTINASITCAGIKIAICPSDTSKVYCFAWKSGATSPFGGVYLSTNNGTSFTLKADTPNILGYSGDGTSMDGQGAYNMAFIVDPTNANTIYIGAINIWKSTNQGAAFSLLSHWGYGVHADKHNFIFSPYNNNKLFICHDGGIDRSLDGGLSWTTLEDGLSASEFYKLGASGLYNDYVIGGLQDNGEDISVNKNFSTIRGGDWGGDFAFDVFDSSILYENGSIKRNIVSNTSYVINGRGGNYLPHPNDSNTMFEIDTNLWRTSNLRVSPSTNVTWSKLSSIAGATYASTNCVGYSKSSSGTLYMYVSPQLFYKSTDINSPTPTFTQITTFPFFSGEVIKQIETCDYDSNTVYVVTNQTRIYKSSNKGLTWVLLNKNLPANNFIKFELDQKTTDSSMYICTAFGVYYRNSTLGNWIPFSQGLPIVAQITDMEIMSDGTNKSRLFISTYGRGIWQTNLYNTISTAPIADFTMLSSSNQSCATNFILVDNSSNTPTSRKWNITPASGWSFINGTDSTSSRAEIQITTSATYYISLTVSNAYGTNVKTINKNYSPVAAASCVTTTTNLSGFGMGIQRFEFNTINNPSTIGVASNTDFSCNNNTIVKAGGTYTAWITTGSTNSENQKIYIDYNNNGVFTDANELVGTNAIAGMGRRSCSVTILSSPPIANQFLRMRVVTNFSTSATPPCGVLSYGESEDYAIFIDTIKPTVSLSMTKPTVYGNFIATYTTSENVYGFDNADINVSGGSSSNFIQLSPTTFSSVIIPTVVGKILITLNANTLTDFAGNGNNLTKDSTTYQLPLIETAIASAVQNFGPNETDTFYSSSGKIMAVLMNNSSFNYGPTMINIDSSGIGGRNYSTNTAPSKMIAKKTYTVLPTNANATGNYTIKLYYTAAEINGWKLATGNNFSTVNIIKCPTNIASGTLANGTYGAAVNISNYSGSDSVVIATFSNGFSGFAIGANAIVLPITLLNFEAIKYNQIAKLFWSTSTELNNKLFEIERSVDMIHFIKIGELPGAGNSSSIKNYYYDDLSFNKLKSKFVYYRLKQIDNNGSITYSEIRNLETENQTNGIVIMPIPANDFINVFVDSNIEYRFEIFDASGKGLLKGSSSNPKTTIDISTFTKGMYFIQIKESSGKNGVLKFIKE